MTDPALVEVENLSFAYGENAILEGVNLRIEPGQAMGILGPNGAGKTTLLSAMTRSVKGVYGGQTLIGGRTDWSTHSIGFATQEVSLYALLTGAENLIHTARLLDQPDPKAAVAAVVDELGLASELLEQPVSKLSGGQKRLLHVACAVVHRPPVILLDEPTAALDFHVRSRLVDLCHRWVEEGRALLVTSHYPEDIEEICTDAVLLREGSATALGSLTGFLASRQGQRIELTIAGQNREVEFDGQPTVGRLAAVLAGERDDLPIDGIEIHRPTVRRLLQEALDDDELTGEVWS